MSRRYELSFGGNLGMSPVHRDSDNANDVRTLLR